MRADVHYPVAWPVTRAVARAGFTDTYRAVHPDPVATPGITWTFGYPFPRRAANEVIDRIDFVQASRGRRRSLDSGIVGPSGHARRHRTRSTRTPPTTAPSSPTVRFTPARPGAVRVGARPARRARRPDRRPLRRPARRGDRHAADRARRAAARATRSMILPPQEASFFGAVTLRLGRACARPLRRAARRPAATASLSRSTFWVVAPNARAAVRGPGARPRGRPIRVSWTTRPASAATGSASGRPATTTSTTTTSRSSTPARRSAGATTIAGDASTFPPGRYVVRLMKDDGYGELARSSFTVTRR